MMIGEPFPGDVYPEMYVYPQEAWHSPAAVIGNRKAIEQLRSLCDKALADGESVGEFMPPDDGEGYFFHVKIVDEKMMERLTHYYSYDVAAIDNRPDTVSPWDICG